MRKRNAKKVTKRSENSSVESQNGIKTTNFTTNKMCSKVIVRHVFSHSAQLHPKLYPNYSHTTLLMSKAGRSNEYGITMDTLCLWLVSPRTNQRNRAI